jgi:hypothetical protein
MKIPFFSTVKLLTFIAFFHFSFSFALAAETQISQDYHMSLYKDVQGSTDSIELFTKIADKRAFLGITCSSQSPMPLIQVILFDDEVISETPKLLSVKLLIDGEPVALELQGITKVVDNTEEFSNKIRLEVVAQRGSSFKALQDHYRKLLKLMQQGHEVKLQLSHHSLESKEIEFSLNGLDKLLIPNQHICF